jgi:hypothetical protein
LPETQATATITLKYNARNRMAPKTIDYVLSLGLFETTMAETTRAGSGADITREAIEAAERGEYRPSF